MAPFCEASVAPIVKVGAFSLSERKFYGDSWFISRKIESDAFDSPNVGFKWVDGGFFGGEYFKRDRWISIHYTGFVWAWWGGWWDIWKCGGRGARLTQYLLEHGVNEVDLGFATSLGGVVLFEMLNFGEIKFKRLFFEGVSFYESSKLGGFLMTKIMLAKQKKGLKNPKLAVEKMSKMFGNQAGKVMAERFLKMDPQSIKNIVRDCSNVRLPKMDMEMQKSCVFSYGEKDSDLRLARRKISKMYPEAKLVVDEGYGHCERMVKDAEGYVKWVIGVD